MLSQCKRCLEKREQNKGDVLADKRKAGGDSTKAERHGTSRCVCTKA